MGEKDAGEPFFALQDKKDMITILLLSVQNLGRMKSLALGNYKLSFGQGLVLGTDFGLGKTFLCLRRNIVRGNPEARFYG